jgi:hypothetical protein
VCPWKRRDETRRTRPGLRPPSGRKPGRGSRKEKGKIAISCWFNTTMELRIWQDDEKEDSIVCHSTVHSSRFQSGENDVIFLDLRQTFLRSLFVDRTLSTTPKNDLAPLPGTRIRLLPLRFSPPYENPSFQFTCNGAHDAALTSLLPSLLINERDPSPPRVRALQR